MAQIATFSLAPLPPIGSRGAGENQVGISLVCTPKHQQKLNHITNHESTSTSITKSVKDNLDSLRGHVKSIKEPNLSNFSFNPIPEPWLAKQPTDNSNERTDTGDGKRKKRKILGFACNYNGCPKKFDLACQANKHYKSAHTKGEKSCPLCERRFHWDKDVRRHCHRIHSIDIDELMALNVDIAGQSQVAEAPVPKDNLRRDNANAVVVTSDGAAQSRKPKKLRSVVLAIMAAINLGSNENALRNNGWVFVTHDNEIFHQVQLSGLRLPDTVPHHVIGTLVLRYQSSDNEYIIQHSPVEPTSEGLHARLHFLAYDGSSGRRLTWTRMTHTIYEHAQRGQLVIRALHVVHKDKILNDEGIADHTASLRVTTDLDLRHRSHIDRLLNSLTNRTKSMLAASAHQSNSNSRCSRSRSQVPLGADETREPQRCQSLPPNMFRHCGPGEAHGTSKAYEGSNSPVNREAKSNQQDGNGQKRMSDENDGDKSHDGDPNRAKRLKGGPCEHDEGSLGCIFHVGEPWEWQDDTRKHKYMSELQKHLQSRRHRFYACYHCIKKFHTYEQYEGHECARICRTPGCLRHRGRDEPDDPAGCDHIFSARQQWLAVYHLQYPGSPTPHGFRDVPRTRPAFSQEVVPSVAANTSQDGGYNSLSLAAPVASSSHSAISLVSLNNTNEQVLVDTAALNSLEADVRLANAQRKPEELWNYIKLLQDKLTHSDSTQEQLTAVLGMVWHALVMTGCSASKERSVLWCLVKAHAPDAVATVPHEAINNSFEALSTWRQDYSTASAELGGDDMLGYTTMRDTHLDAFLELDLSAMHPTQLSPSAAHTAQAADSRA